MAEAQETTKPSNLEEHARKYSRIGDDNVKKDGHTPEGPGHHHGGGAPNQQINTWARGNSSLQDNMIEVPVRAEDLPRMVEISYCILWEHEELLLSEDAVSGVSVSLEVDAGFKKDGHSPGRPGHHHAGGGA